MNIGRNQFLFTHRNANLSAVVYETKVEVADYLFLLGPNCNYTLHSAHGRDLVILGYCVDVSAPECDGQQMCDKLLKSLSPSCDNVTRLTEHWGGRWVAFAQIDHCWHIWNDTCGLKQCFCFETEDKLTAASQARTIGQLHNLQENPKAQTYIQSAKTADKEYAWPVNQTLYGQVARLLPNHIWKQGSGRAVRMDDILILREVKLPEKKAMELLRNGMRAAAAHKKLAITVTAGWDSRLALAACSAIKGSYSAVTLRYADMPQEHPDLLAAKQLTQLLDIDHKVLWYHEEDGNFTQRYCEHSENAHPYWIQMAQQTFICGYGESLWVKGACNEILRNPNGILYNWQITPRLLCKLFKLPQTSFAQEAVSLWLKEARPYCSKHRYRLLDLFYWEHRMGSWLAECLNEADIASDMYSPFNVRSYLSTGYQIPWKYRVAPDYVFFRNMLEEEDPAFLKVPINRGKSVSVKTWVKHLLKNHLHLLYGFFLTIKR